MSFDGSFPAFPTDNCRGLTAREYVATHLLASMLANPALTPIQDHVLVNKASSLTDALLKELSK